MKIDFSKLIPIAAFLMAFFLPLHRGLSNLFLILVFVTCFFLYVFQKRIVWRNPKYLLGTLLPIFILQVVGIFYSDPSFIGAAVLGKTVSFLLCPLILLFLPKEVLFKIKSSLKKGIVTGSLLSISVLLINNVLNYFATRPFPSIDDEFLGFYFTYHKFTEPFVEYAAYLGAYVVFSVAILLVELFKQKRNKYLILVGLVILSIGVVFINARIVMLIYGVTIVTVVLMGIVLFFRRKKYWSLGLLTLGTFLALFISYTTLSNSFIETRLTDELKWELSDQVSSSHDDRSVADSRIPRWRAAYTVIAGKPIFGYGTYTEKNVLVQQYEKDGLWASVKNKYDAHNMYLSFAVEYGVVGLLIFLFFIAANCFVAFRNHNAIYLFLVLMFMAISIFESYLHNNAGITFIALFVTTFFYSDLFNNPKIAVWKRK